MEGSRASRFQGRQVLDQTLDTRITCEGPPGGWRTRAHRLANVTAAGFGRHVEIGVEVAGPQVRVLERMLDALQRRGTVVIDAGPAAHP